jgi:cytidylate kinase
MQAAEDATVIDTTSMGIEEVVEQVLALCQSTVQD